MTGCVRRKTVRYPHSVVTDQVAMTAIPARIMNALMAGVSIPIIQIPVTTGNFARKMTSARTGLARGPFAAVMTGTYARIIFAIWRRTDARPPPTAICVMMEICVPKMTDV